MSKTLQMGRLLFLLLLQLNAFYLRCFPLLGGLRLNDGMADASSLMTFFFFILSKTLDISVGAKAREHLKQLPPSFPSGQIWILIGVSQHLL